MEHVTDGYPDVSPEYMKPTEYFDFDVDAVRAFAFASVGGASDAREKAIKLFYAVRDTIRYDPYSITLEPTTYKASTVLAARSGFCLPKANLLIACARATGIPAGIGLADVKNHLCTERLRRMMGGKDLFLHHGFAVLHIDGNWVKAAPAFNIELCKKFDVVPTDFDGEHHALFQQYDAKGRYHMEYVADHGVWSDFPFDRMAKDFRDYYPASIYDPEARAEIDREIKAEKQAFEDERPLS
ncbi:MAG: transglutaminase family protein [Proteobacteria bacterium]|nr:transglutaminase family protein [Pseudomonadota bacterium]